MNDFLPGQKHLVSFPAKRGLVQPWLKSELLAASPPTSERFEFPPAPACSVPGVCAVGSSGSGRWAHCHVGILTLLSSVQSLPVDPGGITMKQSQDQLLLSAGQRALGFTVFSTKQDDSCAQSGVLWASRHCPLSSAERCSLLSHILVWEPYF